MLNRKVFEIKTGQTPYPYQEIDTSHNFPDIPVLPETLLMMEIAALGSPVDLGRITEIVLGDLGATIQIMRRARAECSFGEQRFNRLEDCISLLGVQECIEAASRLTVTRTMNKPAILNLWSHARVVAEECKRTAADAAGDMNPGEAYLTGLFHELGSLPVILEWAPELAMSVDSTAAGFRLAEAWSLPSCVLEYFGELCHRKTGSRRAEIVQRAHHMLISSPIERSSDHPPESRVLAFVRS